MTAKKYFGHCLCKKVGYSIAGEVRNLCYCHCESCRRAAGSVSVAWGTVDYSHFRITKGQLATVNSSQGVERGFCGDCGSALTYRHQLRSNEIDFTLATLEQPSAMAPQSHIWVQDKLPWVKIADGLPQYQTVAQFADS